MDGELFEVVSAPVWPARVRKPRVPAAASVALAILMTGYLLRARSLFDWQVLIVAGLAVSFPFGYLACSRRVDAGTRDCCWMLMLGYLGMLAGLIFDAGGVGFGQLVALCRSGSPSGFGSALDSVSRMPAAYLGMAAGCQCAIWLLPSRGRTAASQYARWVATNAWMVLGMLLGHWAAMILAADLSWEPFESLVLVSMLTGMTISSIFAHWNTAAWSCICRQ
jgi:hypothetical protein